MFFFVIFHPYRFRASRRLNNIESNRARVVERGDREERREKRERREERKKMGKGNGFEENRRVKRPRESSTGGTGGGEGGGGGSYAKSLLKTYFKRMATETPSPGKLITNYRRERKKLQCLATIPVDRNHSRWRMELKQKQPRKRNWSNSTRLLRANLNASSVVTTSPQTFLHYCRTHGLLSSSLLHRGALTHGFSPPAVSEATP